MATLVTTLVQSVYVADVTATIKAIASQTGDLTQWLSSSGTTLSKVDVTGSQFWSNSGTTVSGSTGRGLFVTNAAATTPLIAKGASSQSANLQEWQDSGGTVVALVNASGSLVAGGPSHLSARLSVYTATAGTIGAVIRGYTSQTADLQQWQNTSGNVLVQIDKDGTQSWNQAGGSTLHILNSGTGVAELSRSGGRVDVGTAATDYGARLNVGTLTTSKVGVIVRGVASQSGDLQQWQDTNGTIAAKVDSSGQIWASTGKSYANQFAIGNSSLGGRLGVGTANDAVVGIIVKAHSGSQSANLQEWQDSNATVLASIGPTGILTIAGSSTNSFSGPIKINANLDDLLQTQLNHASSAGRLVTGYRQTAKRFTVELQASSSDDIVFKTATGSAGSEAYTETMRLLNTGGYVTVLNRFGVGLAAGTAPSYPVDISGNTKIAGYTGINTNPGNSIARLYTVEGAGGAPAAFNATANGTGVSAATFYQAASSATAALVIIKLGASQTGDALQVKDSSDFTRWNINNVGQMEARTAAAAVSVTISGLNGTIVSAAQAVGNIPITARGYSGQTASLQEWQNSNSTVLAKIDKDGKLTTAGLTTTGDIIPSDLLSLGTFAAPWGDFNTAQANIHVGNYTAAALNVTVGAETSARFELDGNGLMIWGSGSAQDTNLYRSAANVLKTDDSLIVIGSVTAASYNSLPITVSNTSAIIMGSGAGTAVTTGATLTVIGYNAGQTISTTSDVVAIGANALLYPTGSGVVAVGTSALRGYSNAANGQNNTGIGQSAGYSIAGAGASNTFVGASAGFGDNSGGTSTGSNNVAVGYQTLKLYTTAGSNTALGQQAGYNITTGGNNTAVGYQAGYTVNIGTYNVALGHTADHAAGSSYQIAIGYGATTTAANQLVIGGSTGYINDVYIGKGVTHASPLAVVINATGGSGSNIPGANLVLASGKGTGSAASGSILFQTSAAGSSGTTLQSLATRVTIDSTGKVGIGGTPTHFLHVHSGHMAFTGITAPGALTAAVGTAGALTGTYYYKVTYVTADGETELGTVASVVLSAQRASLTNIPVSSDPKVTSRKIYRGVAGNSTNFFLVTTLADNTTTTYTDNTEDNALGAIDATYRSNTTAGKFYWNGFSGGAIGNYSTAFGYNSLNSNATGYGSVAVGVSALANVTIGSYNTATGHGAGALMTSGSSNTALGGLALFNNTTSSFNTAVGSAALYTATGGSNTAIGVSAGYSVSTGSHNIAIGTNADHAANVDYQIAIGRVATTTAAHQLVIGGSSTYGYINDAYLGSGVTDTAPVSIVINASGGNGTNVAGANLTLAAGKGTGNAVGGSIFFQTSTVGSSGTTLQSLATQMTINSVGRVGLGDTPDSVIASRFTSSTATAASAAGVFVQTASGATKPVILVQLGASPGAGGDAIQIKNSSDTVVANFKSDGVLYASGFNPIANDQYIGGSTRWAGVFSEFIDVKGASNVSDAFTAFYGTKIMACLDIFCDGAMWWGSGDTSQDTSLYRSAAARLKTDHLFTAALGVATKVKAGTPTDGDWAANPPDGTIVGDSTGSKIWIRLGGTWKSIAVA